LFCLCRLPRRKTLKDIDDLAVRNLTKIRVVSADGTEGFVILKADDVVSLAVQFGNPTGWRYRHREDEFFGTARKAARMVAPVAMPSSITIAV